MARLTALISSVWAEISCEVLASVLVLGRVSDDPKSHYDQLKPLLDYVVPRMASVGIRSGRILMAKDAQQMGSYLRRGRVDWVTETAGTAMARKEKSLRRIGVGAPSSVAVQWGYQFSERASRTGLGVSTAMVQ